MVVFKKVVAILSVALLAVSIGSSSIVAQESPVRSDVPIEAQQTATQVRVPRLKDKLITIRDEQKTALDAAKIAKIAARCEFAQDKLVNYKGRIEAYREKHTDLYEKLLSRVNAFIVRLEAAAIDSSGLNAAINEVDEMISVTKTDFATYEGQVNDLISSDCAADPQAFYGEVQVVKKAHSYIVQEITAINKSIREVIKIEVAAIKTQLESTANGEGA